MPTQIILTFKTPDVFDQIQEQVEDLYQRDQFNNLAKRFVEYGEYITITLDLEKQIATIKEK